MSDLLITIPVSALSGFGAGLVAWIAGVFFGQPIARLVQLKRDAHTAINACTGLASDGRYDAAAVERAKAAQANLRKIASEIEAIYAVLPRSAARALKHVLFDLADAAAGLRELSIKFAKSQAELTCYKVKALHGLRLPVDPTDQAVYDRRTKLEGVTL